MYGELGMHVALNLLLEVVVIFSVIVLIVLCTRKHRKVKGHIRLITQSDTDICKSLAKPWEPMPRTQQPWMPWNWMERFHANVANSSTNGSNINVLFYGDSITEGFDWPIWNRVFAPLGAANYAISGDTTQHVLWRIRNGEVDNISPRIVVLMIGTNNIGTSSAANIAHGIMKIVDELLKRLPKTRVLLLGILPRTSSAGTAITEQVNTFCASRDNLNNIRFLNMRDGFYRGNGKFYKDLYTSGDLLHINAAGYAKWEELMNPLFTQMWHMANDL